MNGKENVDNNLHLVSDSPKSSIKNESFDPIKKKSVRFNKVDVYHFERCQGYLSIPSSENDSNSITLGMKYWHHDFQSFDCQEEFIKYKRKQDLDKINHFLNSIDTSSELTFINDANTEKAKEIISKRDYYEENIEQDLGISADIVCPILTVEQRIEKLINIGYSREEIDKNESEDIKLIRKSRLVCGCICSKMNMVCGENGDLCSCFANGINCQIDRLKFPCSCNIKKCKNLYGMKRFDPKSVFNHYKKVLNGNIEEKPKQRGRKRKNSQNKGSEKRKKFHQDDTESAILSIN